MIVAVIPARGGSKRIPRKNIRPFAGKPIIAYSIAAARQCRLFDRIIVSTDDEEIAGGIVFDTLDGSEIAAVLSQHGASDQIVVEILPFV